MSVSELDRFIRASDALISFQAYFNDIKEDVHTVFTLELHSDELKTLMDTVKLTYQKCLDFLSTSDTAEPDDIDVTSAKYQSTYTAFVNCLSKIRERLHNYEETQKTSDSPVVNSNSESHHNLVVPPCDVETFDGEYLSWPSFRDLFTALYVNNSRLSNIERMCHLIRKTSGDAKDIVSKYPLSNLGFDMAWSNLRAAYENPRMLVNNQLKILFNLPILDKETSVGLKTIQRGINSCLSALSIYKVSTENWDPMIVFMCIQRLPDCTVTLWEQSIKDKFVLSVWKDLDAFLTERIQTLECLRDIREVPQTKKSVVQKVNTHHATSSSSHSCSLCKNQSHFLRDCKRFKKLSVMDRFSTVKKNNWCINCLSRTHQVKECKSIHSCSICKKRHHTLLHRNEPSKDSSGSSRPSSSSVGTSAISQPTHSRPIESSQTASTSGFSSSAPLNRQAFHISRNQTVLLGTAMVNIHHQGMTYPARALIDPASETSFISERVQNRLKISAHSTNAKISGINQAISVTARKSCSIYIGTPLDSSIILNTIALVLPTISGNLPSFIISNDLRKDLPNIRLADSQFFDCRPVDLLLGADLFPQIIMGSVRNVLGTLLAQETIFGWIITGPVPQSSVQVYNTRVDFSEEDNLNRILLRFWELEEPPKRKIMSAHDLMCEENYRKTTRRDSDGRYVVKLPFKPEFPDTLFLGHSKQNVRAQFLRTESSLLRNPLIKNMYDDVVREYLTLDHMRPVREESISSCYLPHHPVIKLDRKTTKLRVVFNASNKTSNGHSLNDCLFVGPTLQADLVLLILRWRFFRFVFNCDITQMYRQIRLDRSHTPFQRILFRDTPTEEIKEYELQTVTFGVNCAPYLAIRTLLQLADDVECKHPLAAEILRKCMYVDDVLNGTHDIPTALIARDQLIAALSSAGFELRKWTSNEKAILAGFPVEHLVDAKLLKFVESSSSKTLGLQWNAHLDSFYFNVDRISMRSSHTKREVLSIIARLFDPVGWLGPVIIVAKMVMQRVWQDQVEWDESLKPATEAEWQKFASSYHEVNQIQIPRWVHYVPNSKIELHVFSDASEKAYAAVIYARIETPDGEIFTHLLTSKTKVAPIKSISLPRLELCGAVLAVDLLKSLLYEIDIPLCQIYCWTDSTIVLAWLKKDPCSWATFVANRVCKIQEIVGRHNWHHVKSEENPADLGSRGISPSDLSHCELWWHGPYWLREKSTTWNFGYLSLLDTDLEARAVKSHASFFNNYEDILERFSSLDRAIRVLAYVFRFFYKTHSAHRNRNSYESTTVTNIEVKQVKLRLAILAQKVNFAEEYKCLLEKRPLSSKSSLLTLNPFLDNEGVMRLNGRLAKSPSLVYTERHPILLPYSCRFTLLLTEFVHMISIHGGNQLMLRILRIEYWVPRLRTLVRAVVNRCKRCILDRKRTCTQIMAALPPERTQISRPFTTTGVDFAGPFDMKNLSGRSGQILKAYVCIFVCFSTKAIHLEVSSDLSTDKFLAAFNRFISRRGCPTTMFSDNGTNFVGASREIERDFKTFLLESRARMCSTFGINGLSWRFIPAGAPHMGGLWEAGVRSFKLHFRKEAQSVKYTFEELSTVLARIEACLNSRPLCPMSDNPNEPVALTPGHFLIGSPILAPPEPSIYESPLSLVNRYRKVKALTHHFCRRWKEEYLTNLHKRYKWKWPEREIAKGDLVVIRNEQLSPTSWKLGRVVKTYPGSDSHVRVADIRTENGVVKRPITKLVVLAS
ncbi:uncharacterized protein LOC135962859 [Calliphora vicina]|uniref:uncharacterized protein LOC135962859 n=1 Tax=Calliphora vicina TaxID=7373 RepID=UPI00325AE329